jgi:tryptophan synthase alpha chain
MSGLDGVFANRPALIGYLTVGYPSIAATRRLVPLLAAAGCDLIELGIPFSDPLADGATIQKASHQALLNGVTPQRCLDLVAEIRQKCAVPLAFMTYYNLILSYGLARFCARAGENGVGGLIIPDLPPDEGSALQEAANGHGIDLVYLLAPTSTDQRIRLVAERAQGFIYLVSLTGVTGARATLPADLEDFVARVRSATSLPLAVGFGISTPEQAARVGSIADGVIVGSRILQIAEGDDERFTAVSQFTRSLKDAMRAAVLDRS